MKTYLPSEFLNQSCYTITPDYISVWSSTNTDIENLITNIYFKNDYMIQESYSIYNNEICVSSDKFTDEIYYRTDIDRIAIITTLVCGFCFYMPFLILTRLFRRLN